MGYYGVIVALAGIISALACLRYEMAIPLPDNLQSAIRLLKICVGMVVVTTFLSGFYALLCVLSPKLSPSEDLGLLIWFLPLLVLCSGVINCMFFWCNRIASFGLLSQVRILTATVTGLVIVPIAWLFGGDGYWLFLGNAAAFGLGAYYIFAKSGLRRQGQKISSTTTTDFSSYKDLLREYRRFPSFNAPMTLLDQLAAIAPALLFTIYYSAAETGQYHLCMLVLRAPSSLIGSAVGQVFYSRAARLRNDFKSLSRLVKGTTLLLVAIAIPMILVISFFGPDLFSGVFSEKWRKAGELAGFMVWPAALVLICSPTSMLPSLLNLQHKQFFITGFGSVARVSLLWYGCATADIETALLWAILAECTALLSYGGWIVWEMVKRGQPT